MSVVHVVGVDPGLVHSGVVGLRFNTIDRTLDLDTVLVQGLGVDQIADWSKVTSQVFIEAYRPRQRLNNDVRMMQAEQALRAALPSAKFIPNMGIKKIVTQELMEMLGVWKFSTTSHHQDLRSAARIALLGMMKSTVMNQVLATVVRDNIDQQTWTIRNP